MRTDSAAYRHENGCFVRNLCNFATKRLFPRRGYIKQPRVAAKPLPWDSNERRSHSLKGIDNRRLGVLYSSLSGMDRVERLCSQGSALPHYPGLVKVSPSGKPQPLLNPGLIDFLGWLQKRSPLFPFQSSTKPCPRRSPKPYGQ